MDDAIRKYRQPGIDYLKFDFIASLSDKHRHMCLLRNRVLNKNAATLIKQKETIMVYGCDNILLLIAKPRKPQAIREQQKALGIRNGLQAKLSAVHKTLGISGPHMKC
ncbi:hypothetical protein Trydic_g535 [Trypoxylus dichotomus]